MDVRPQSGAIGSAPWPYQGGGGAGVQGCYEFGGMFGRMPGWIYEFGGGLL